MAVVRDIDIDMDVDIDVDTDLDIDMWHSSGIWLKVYGNP